MMPLSKRIQNLNISIGDRKIWQYIDPPISGADQNCRGRGRGKGEWLHP
jgi:hypothetical protein